MIALDGFGAERGFDVLAEGARLAAADGIRLRVFGPGSELGIDGEDGIEVVETEDWISNEDDPVSAVRSREEASIVRAAADVAAGTSEALVSVGATGATMAAATFGLRRLQGVQRPALAVQLPIPGRPVLFLDVGANTSVRPSHLVQFAYLGAAFSEAVLGVSRPRVGLLSVGEEAGKGTEQVAAAHGVLAGAQGIDFVGNVEGRDIPAGEADVVVTDGFTGNVAVKLMEGPGRRRRDPRRGEVESARRRRRPADAAGAGRRPPRARSRHDRRGDPPRPARDRRRRARQLGPRRGRQRGPPRGPWRRGRRRRPHGRSARAGRSDPGLACRGFAGPARVIGRPRS